jgi:hypothetical protein
VLVVGTLVVNSLCVESWMAGLDSRANVSYSGVGNIVDVGKSDPCRDFLCVDSWVMDCQER